MLKAIRITLILSILAAVTALLIQAGTTQAVQPQKPAAPTGATEDCGCDEAVAPGPQVWAVVSGTKFFDTDLKAVLAPQLDPLLKQLKELRQQGLEDLVNSKLVDKEAKATGMSRVDLIRQRVDSKLAPPTEAEIQAFIDKNRATINRDPKAPDYRNDVALFLKDQSRVIGIRNFGMELRKKYQVNILPEVGSTTDLSRVVAIVDQVPVRRSELEEFVKAGSFDLKTQIYSLRKQVLDRGINQFLIQKEAAKRGTTVQILFNKEVLDKAPLVTVEQANAFYEANKAQFQQPLQPLEVVRPNLMVWLRQQNIAREEERFSAELRNSVSIKYSIPSVIEPVFTINITGKPTTGPKDAPVTIIEFSDYECPRCGEIQPLVKQVLAAYPTKVRMVSREFPLTRHAFARKAAQAAQCAFEQGKYWEYTALLYKNQLALDENNLLKYAGMVGLDRATLAAHLKSGFHDKIVQEDLDEGLQVGVNGTPTFYVNGKRLEDRSLEGFKQAIEKALAGR
jgi:predicted DsbA family dithiol-disulfide isomerase